MSHKQRDEFVKNGGIHSNRFPQGIDKYAKEARHSSHTFRCGHHAANIMHMIHRFIGSSIAIVSLLLLTAACGPEVNQIKPQQTVTVGKTFQTQATPIPTVPPYRCGAWTSNNAPNPDSTILVLAKLTKNIQGVQGATAAATAHFADGDVPLDTQPTSDQGGMVSFTLPLQGRQPTGIPATISVSFTIGGTTVQCSSAFFTPK